MNLQHYIGEFSRLRMHRARGGRYSPHKVCMLLAVMDLVADGVLTLNRIYYNETLTRAFTKRFEQLSGGQGQARAFVPYYYLRSADFWQHQVRQDRISEYRAFDEIGNTEKRIKQSIEYAYVDPPLFEYFKSHNARSALTAALAENFNDETMDQFLVPQSGWSWLECELAVDGYFKMLAHELKGEAYDKSAHNRGLRDHLNRTSAAINRQYQHISAILVEFGMPIVGDFKPLPNYQLDILPDVIGAKLAQSTEFETIIENINQQTYPVPSVEDIDRYLVDPPKVAATPSNMIRETPAYAPSKVDYLKTESNNRNLGRLGEQFIVNYERARLIREGKASLAEQVDHVSQQDDRLGYDIHSYEKGGQDRFIEVKTTNYDAYTRFYVTKNEVQTSERLDSKYYLYRVFNFRASPLFFQCRGSLHKRFSLDPSNYVARIRETQ